MQGRLEWYCLDYWSAELSLDLRALKDASSHRVRFLPGAREFLARLHASGKHVAVVTNAHGDALDMKKSVAGLGRYIDIFVSSHEFGVPKEGQAFWSSAQERLGFDPQQTLFIDDSTPVLDAARTYGIRGLLAVNRPTASGLRVRSTDMPQSRRSVISSSERCEPCELATRQPFRSAGRCGCRREKPDSR